MAASTIKILLCLSLLCLNALVYCQDAETDSLLKVANYGKDDSLKVNALISLAINNSSSAPDTALAFAGKARDIAVKIGFKSGEGYAYKWLGIINNYKGNYYEALVNSNKSLNIFEALDDKIGTSNLLNNLGAFYADKGEDSRAVEYYLRSLDLAQQSGNKLRIETALGNIGVIYFKNPATNDSALKYYLQALPYALEIKDAESTGILYSNIGEVYAAKDEFEKARYYYDKSLEVLGSSGSIAYTYNDLGKLYKKKKLFDSAGIFFDKAQAVAEANNSSLDITQSLIGKAKLQLTLNKFSDAIAFFNKALAIAKPSQSTPELKEIYKGLSSAYTGLNDYKNALSFENQLNELYDTENQEKLSFNTATLEYTMELLKQSGQLAALKKENELQELKIAKEKLAKNASIAGIAILLVVAIFMMINIRQRKKLNQMLSSQKEEIQAQKSSVEKTLVELKAAQAQLVQSEKMASLGELTAGIAHEIRNPLNFVNNFSEVNSELINDMKQAILNGNYDEVVQLASDIEENEQKINHHGKRADAIVKGMLQHSRKNTGQKEPTDINALAGEYLRLTYHNLKAKDKLLNVEIKSDFDPSIEKVNVVPQDIGIVLLNLINNAFYAVAEKKKKTTENYHPLVFVQTKKINDQIEIIVKDNGTGIPQSVIDKIYQPFFTTKSAGEGTGLGLSLSYDIITKEHNGTIRVESKEGQETMFIIRLPL